MAGWHEQTLTPEHKTANWPACNAALKRRGSLTIFFDLAMIWEAAPTGKRGHQPDYGGEEDQKTVRGTVFQMNAIQTGLTMKVLLGMALRQTTLQVNIPYRVSGVRCTC